MRVEPLETLRESARYIAIAWLMFAALAGCGPGRRTVLVVAMNGGAVSLDPHTQDEFVTINILANVYEGLVGMDPNLRVVPMLAKGYDNPHSNAWRFHLRPEARFHDGRPVRAEDVVYSLKRAREHPRSIFAGDMSVVYRINALDSLTVEVRTDQPRPMLINLLAAVSIMPRNFEPGEAAMGTGPYRFVRFLERRGVALHRFEGYWGSRPHFVQAEFRCVPDDDERLRLLLSGEADVDALLGTDQRRRLEGDGRALIRETPYTTVWLLGGDLKPGRGGNPLADPRVRRAVSLAVDREQLVREVLGGQGQPANQIAPPTVLGYNPGLPVPERDVGAARRLLAGSGFAKGLELRLLLKPMNHRVGELLEGQLAEAGIRLTADTVAWDSLYRGIEQGTVPFYMYGLAFSYGDASEGINELHSHAPGELGHRNNTGYSNPRLDSIIQSAFSEFDPAGRQELLQRAMAIVAEDLPLIPLYFQRTCYGVKKGLQWTPRSDEMILAKEFRWDPRGK